MKRFITAAVIAFAMLTSTNAVSWGLSWESVSSWGNETLEPVKYRVSAAGNDLRVYEWVTPTKPHQKCIFVASESDTNLQCSIVEEQDVQPKELLNQDN